MQELGIISIDEISYLRRRPEADFTTAVDKCGESVVAVAWVHAVSG